jgi:hypothetical protein
VSPEVAPPAPVYTTHVADVARDREAVLAIWRGNLGRLERLESKYDWFYRGCPWGAPLVVLLRHEPSGRWVGVASAGERRMHVGDRGIRAGVLVDMAVDQEHRSLGPALILQRGLLAAAAARFEVVYGFPNPKAAPVFGRVGYARLGDSIRHVRVLRFRGYLARRIPAWLAPAVGVLLDIALRLRVRWSGGSVRGCQAAWSSRFESPLDTLCTRGGPVKGPASLRDGALLRWRFDEEPASAFRYLAVSERGGAPFAYFACEPEDPVLHVRDYWLSSWEPARVAAAVVALCREARKAGYASVSAEMLGPDRLFEGWRAAGFVERGRRPVMGKVLDERLAGDDGLEWMLTPVDEDE